jgi:chromosome segregation ATPase
MANAANAATQNSASSSQVEALQTSINQLEAENARLRQTNQQLTANSTNQNSTASSQIAALTTRVNQLETENNRLKQSEQTLNQNLSEMTKNYNTMTDNYNQIKPSSDAYLALIKAYGVYKNDPNSLSDLEHFLNMREASNALPGLTERVRTITNNLIVAARKEALNTASSILDTALRIQSKSTKKLYLEGVRIRYLSDQTIVAFIDVLLKSL